MTQSGSGRKLPSCHHQTLPPSAPPRLLPCLPLATPYRKGYDKWHLAGDQEKRTHGDHSWWHSLNSSHRLTRLDAKRFSSAYGTVNQVAASSATSRSTSFCTPVNSTSTTLFREPTMARTRKITSRLRSPTVTGRKGLLTCAWHVASPSSRSFKRRLSSRVSEARTWATS